jgi:PAS domain S-box-containing protein
MLVTEPSAAAAVAKAHGTSSHQQGALSALFDQSAAGLAETDLNGRFIAVNDEYCAITGRSREELLSLAMQDITHPDDLPANVQLFNGMLATGQAFEVEKRYVRPDSTSIWKKTTWPFSG